MAQTLIHRAFEPLKACLPESMSNAVRSIGTAILTPILFSYRTGHFLSCMARAAVSAKGEPLPWYTYPVIDFLKNRHYDDKIILEFGGGQSTLWWASRAERVVTLEGDHRWYRKLRRNIPRNVDLHHVSMESPSVCVAQVERILSSKKYATYDVIIIDGLYRYEMIDIARRYMTETGMIICDNAEGYGFFEGFLNSGLNRVDFFGHAAGVILPHATSIFFKSNSVFFSSNHPIPIIAK